MYKININIIMTHSLNIERFKELYDVCLEIGSYPVCSFKEYKLLSKDSYNIGNNFLCPEMWNSKDMENSICGTYANLGGWYENITGESIGTTYTNFADYFGLSFEESKLLFGSNLTLDAMLEFINEKIKLYQEQD